MATKTVDGEEMVERKHRRMGYVVTLRRAFRPEDDTDLAEGLYRGPGGDALGQVFLRANRSGETFLLLTEESMPLVHAEAALEADHRVDSYEQAVALVYEVGEMAPEGVIEEGERWSDGDAVVFIFGTDEDALAAQS